MSFSVPRNVQPNFDNPQRGLENRYWGSSGRSQARNGQARNGIGGKLDDFFDRRQLPMYKDKPYGYGASGKRRAWFRRTQSLAIVLLCALGCLYWLGILSSTAEINVVNKVGTDSWTWLRKAGSEDVDWNERRERVKDAFKLSWDGYENYAWGNDEYHPISKKGSQMTPKGVGWIIVDALDTLMIMNLTSRLSHAREWIETSLDYEQDKDVNTFETTIRMLGGLLSAHYLSNHVLDLGPMASEDQGSLEEDLYLEKAADLADRILGAFESPSGIPYASVNLKDAKGIPAHDNGGASSTAEAASVQLELKYLAMLTGEKIYWERAERVIQVIDDNGMEDGLLPIFISPDDGKFRGKNIRLGSRGDSYYEYLIKQYLQTSEEEPVYLEMWKQVLAGIRKHLVTYSKHAHLTIIGERPHGLSRDLSAKMDHLVCFMPGSIALSITGGLTIEEMKKSGKWGIEQEEEMRFAAELVKTCWGMYQAMATGLAPEITFFEVDDPPHMDVDGPMSSLDMGPEPDAPWRSDYSIKRQDMHNLQRPETVESLYYMWRITGDKKYRELGWEIFKSFVRYSVVGDGAGFASLGNANKIPPDFRDNMESFWLAETLKYFYLLFSPVDLLPLKDIVINTEAHILPRFKLTRGLKTGWKRKPRDEQGKIIIDEKSVISETVEETSRRGKEGESEKEVGKQEEGNKGAPAEAGGGSKQEIKTVELLESNVNVEQRKATMTTTTTIFL